MSASKTYLPTAIACLMIASNSSAIAGTQSPLDPYADFHAPSKGKGAATEGANETYVSMPAPEGDSSKNFLPHPPKITLLKAPKAPKFALPKFGGDDKKKSKVAKADKPERAEDPAPPRHSESSLDKVANGNDKGFTKGIGEGLANTAKSSGNFFMKGAKAIGHGFKNGTSKVASMPFGHEHSDKPEPPKDPNRGKKPYLEPANSKVASTSPKAYPHIAAPVFGQVNGNSDWTAHSAPASNMQNAPATVASNAPNKVQSAHDGGMLNKIPFFGGHNKSLVSGSGKARAGDVPLGPQM